MFDYLIHRVLGMPLRMRVRYDWTVGREKPRLTVVYLHGIASSYAVWRHVIQGVADAKGVSEVRFVAVDLLGFGKSKKPDWLNYDYRDYERAIKATLRKLRVKTPILMVGHSMGGLIATDFATENPRKVAGLVLVSVPFLRPEELRKMPDEFYVRAYSGLKKHSGDAALGVAASFVSMVSSFDKKSLNTEAFRKSMGEIILSRENWKKILKLKKPIVMVHGRLDPLVSAGNLRALARANKQIELVECMGGHDVNGHKCRKVAGIILKMIRGGDVL